MTCFAHDRLSCAECGVVPESREAMIVRRTSECAAFMVQQKLVRFVIEDEGNGWRVEMERHASAFAPAAVSDAPEESAPDPDRCACGHSLSIEHSESGCFHACGADVCNKTEVAS